MDPLIKTALLLSLGLLLWASLSAWLFVTVEYTGKNDGEKKYQSLLSLYESMASKYNMSIEEFNNFSIVAHEALSEPQPQWTYFAALDFVFQALTTIGYGFITPQTPKGQLLCIFVCFIGIPINMLPLKSIGELIAKCVSAIVKKFEMKILKRPEPKRMRTKSAVGLFSVMVVLIVADGLVLMKLKNWSIVEAVYFWFVTFTTIGFGDYVPHKPQRIQQLSINNSRNYKNKAHAEESNFVLLFTFYFIFCLCIVSSVLSSIVAAIEEHRCCPRCPGCVPRKTQDHLDNEEHNTPEQRDTDMTSLEMENVVYQKENITSLSEPRLSDECL